MVLFIFVEKCEADISTVRSNAGTPIVYGTSESALGNESVININTVTKPIIEKSNISSPGTDLLA
ncbi:hypothetical protein JCM18750_38400 [Halostagnicola bangensis]